MFSCYVFCGILACIIAESCSVRLFLHVHHKKDFEDDDTERQEVIDTGEYELRRRRRSLDEPRFLPVSADEEEAEAQDRPSVVQLRQVLSDAGLVGGWSVEDPEDVVVEEAEDGRQRKRQVSNDGRKKLEKTRSAENGRLWALGQLGTNVIFGKKMNLFDPQGAYAVWVSRYGLYVYLPIMTTITLVHIVLWYIWYLRKTKAQGLSEQRGSTPLTNLQKWSDNR